MSEIPSPETSQIHNRHTLDDPTIELVNEKRHIVATAFNNPDEYFISVDGPCPLTINPLATRAEGRIKAYNGEGLKGYISGDREAAYKPRSKKKDWHGLYQSHPEVSYAIMATLARSHGNVLAEIGSMDQMDLYQPVLMAAWFGGRNIGNLALMLAIAEKYPDIPLLVKNGLDGDFAPAIHAAKEIERVRGPKGAPAIPLYRGGANAKTPKASQETYKRAYESTNGRLGYDTGHGTEMAHDPEGNFNKSTAGQVLSSQALVHMSEQGYAPLVKFSEASDIARTMDPHMPLDMGMNDSRRIHAHKLGSQIATAAKIERPYGGKSPIPRAKPKPKTAHSFVRSRY